MYLKKSMIENSIKEIDNLKQNLEKVFDKQGIDFNDNTGRRNAFLSVMQEKSIADQLRKSFKEVEHDGISGKPDIYIKDIDKELECKLTSGTGKKHRTYTLQTDFATICKKKKLDYIYYITTKDMSEYCVVYFEGLTPDDFHAPHSSARGKSIMNKKKAFLKARALFGSIVNKNDLKIKEYKTQIDKLKEERLEKILAIKVELSEKEDINSILSLAGKIKRESDRFSKKVDILKKKIKDKKEADPVYAFGFQKIHEES